MLNEIQERDYRLCVTMIKGHRVKADGPVSEHLAKLATVNKGLMASVKDEVVVDTPCMQQSETSQLEDYKAAALILAGLDTKPVGPISIACHEYKYRGTIIKRMARQINTADSLRVELRTRIMAAEDDASSARVDKANLEENLANLVNVCELLPVSEAEDAVGLTGRIAAAAHRLRQLEAQLARFEDPTWNLPAFGTRVWIVTTLPVVCDKCGAAEDHEEGVVQGTVTEWFETHMGRGCVVMYGDFDTVRAFSNEIFDTKKACEAHLEQQQQPVVQHGVLVKMGGGSYE